MRVPTGAGDVWFKASTEDLRHEAATVDILAVHLPACSEAAYENVMGVNAYKKVLANIERFHGEQDIGEYAAYDRADHRREPRRAPAEPGRGDRRQQVQDREGDGVADICEVRGAVDATRVDVHLPVSDELPGRRDRSGKREAAAA